MFINPLCGITMEPASSVVTVVHFTGYKASLDEETVACLRDRLFALADGASATLVIDFGNVEYLTGRMLGILVSLHKRLLSRKRHLVLINLSPLVHEVFTVTKLDRVLDLRAAGEEVEPALVVDNARGMLAR